MATNARQRRPAPAAAATAAPVPRTTNAAAKPPLVVHKITMDWMPIDDIVPYDWNPRDNAEAVQSVAESIRLTQGFAMPVVIDNNNVLVAGHTRVEAAKVLGLTEVPFVRLGHLSPEAIAAFRMVDNQVASLAKWDFELLAGEIAKLEGSGIDFTDYGWSQGELDCMSQLVAADCLNTETLAPVAQEATQRATAVSRAPTQTRIVVGEFVTYIPASVYRQWATGMRELCNFDEDAIAAELLRRLSINA